MSFVTRQTALAARRLATTTRTTTATTQAAASFSSAAARQKSAVDSAKETLKTVDRKVSDKLVDGIDIGSAYYLFPLPNI